MYVETPKHGLERAVTETHFGNEEGASLQLLYIWNSGRRSDPSADCSRLNLDIRQRVAAIGRRVNTLCQGEAGLRDQLVLFQVHHNFVLPHASLRQALPIPEPAHGTGSARLWRPCTPAMAAGLIDHVWSLKEVLFYHVPPWPQVQTV
jgi:hypothetical protein